MNLAGSGLRGALFRTGGRVGRRTRWWAALLGYAQKLEYPRWIAKHEKARPEAPLESGPLISVLVNAREPESEFFREAVSSLLRQSYPRWELIIAASGESPAGFADPRIRVAGVERSCGAGTALDRAAEIASGEYMAVLGEADVLGEHALGWVAATLQDGAAGALYTDEDAIDDSGRRHAPLFKPDWSPELLWSAPYTGGLFVVSRQALKRAGGFETAGGGGEMHDLALRIAELPDVKVAHVPRVLYHRRGRVRRETNLACAHAGGAAPLRTPRSGALASVIVCSRNPALLERCLREIETGTEYPVRETIAVLHGFESDLGDRRISWTGPFNFSAMNNAGAREASGGVLIFMNDDVRPSGREWLGALVAQVERPEIGIAGALLEYPDGTIQHAGVAIGMAGAAAHPVRGLAGSPLWPWARLTREVSAVTGACLAIRRDVFEQLGGFDPAFPVNYNDVDLCLRARRAGYRVLLEATARLVHDESRSRSGRTTPEERRALFERWRDVIENGDPYYSPQLARDWETPRLNWG